MRSNLETDLAIQLDSNRVEWRYEPGLIELSNGETYLPDFQVMRDPLNIVGAEFIEVKGREDLFKICNRNRLNEEGWRRLGMDQSETLIRMLDIAGLGEHLQEAGRPGYATACKNIAVWTNQVTTQP